MIRTTALLGFLASLTAQGTFPHAVLIETSMLAPRAQVLAIDPVTGVTNALGGFPSDTMTPLAMARDRINGDLILALDAGGGQTDIVRLHRPATTPNELPIATVPGRVVALSVIGNDVFAAVDANNGGIYRMPRRGGTPTLDLPLPNVTAITQWFGNGTLLIAWTGRPGTASPESGTGIYSFATGSWQLGPLSFPNPNGREITGVSDLLTAVPRQLLSFDDGTFATFPGTGPTALTPVMTTIPLPADGAVASGPGGPFGSTHWALGGSGYPHLYELEPYSGTITELSATLPGTPVDFAFGMSTSAHSEVYGSPCGPTAPSAQWQGEAQFGTTFMMGVASIPNAPHLLVAGLDDIWGGSLPLPLPGGCTLEVEPAAVVFLLTDPSGVVFVGLPIPATASAIGVILHAQWVLYDPAGLQTSPGVAHWLGT